MSTPPTPSTPTLSIGDGNGAVNHTLNGGTFYVCVSLTNTDDNVEGQCSGIAGPITVPTPADPNLFARAASFIGSGGSGTYFYNIYLSLFPTGPFHLCQTLSSVTTAPVNLPTYKYDSAGIAPAHPPTPPTSEDVPPAYVPHRKRGTVPVDSATSSWTDTGLVTVPTDVGLSVAAHGLVFFGPPNYWAYPEGAYPADSARPPAGGFPQTTRYDPSAVFTGGWGGAPTLICPDRPPFALVLALYPDGAGAPPTDGSYRGALWVTRGKRFGPEVIPSVNSRIWALFNDQIGQYTDNSGSFTAYLHISGDPSEV